MLKDIYLSNAMIPKRYQQDIHLKIAKVDEESFLRLKEIKQNIKKFVDDGNNLLICSNCTGNGKTTTAIKLLKAYIEEVCTSKKSFVNDTPALFVNVNNFLIDKKRSIGNKQLEEEFNSIEDKILTSNLVVFDDIGCKSLSEYDINEMYYWIDYRTSNLKSCVFTSNQLPDQLKSTLNGKVYSRLVNYSEEIRISDGDHRQC